MGVLLLWVCGDVGMWGCGCVGCGDVGCGMWDVGCGSDVGCGLDVGCEMEDVGCAESLRYHYYLSLAKNE